MGKYEMKISRLTVDKLGVKLYDKVSAVIAELVSNSYDADATEVSVHAPMGQFLATKANKVIKDLGHEIIVIDNGIGMPTDKVNSFYLRVGAERRNDPLRGERSPNFKRKVMGRKGVGKLAPFGVCGKIEVITAGGDYIQEPSSDDSNIEGYRISHFILIRNDILQDDGVDAYEPVIGNLDGSVSPETGTKIILSDFEKRKVPTLDEFTRQLAQRFGIPQQDWTIKLYDNSKSGVDAGPWAIGEFEVEVLENTKITFRTPSTDSIVVGNCPSNYTTNNPDGSPLQDIMPGFSYDGKFYPVNGWVGYSKESYRDDLMAGVRIYCRRKIAAQTNSFNIKSGFTGENSIRSYLVGQLNADWLDEDEDLIQTDRRDLLWSHELGKAFEEWGQSIVKKIGTLSRDPMRKKTADLFLEKSNFDDVVQKKYPGGDKAKIRENAHFLAKTLGGTMRAEEVNDENSVQSVKELALTMAPIITLDHQLKAAASAATTTLSVLIKILKTANIAELTAHGRIVSDRIRVIERLKALKNDKGAVEADFQNVIAEAPWLIDPQWTPMIENQSLKSLKTAFENYYRKRTGDDINLSDFKHPTKRPDFVLTTFEGTIQIIEIKVPEHSLTNTEMERLNRYNEAMGKFLADPANSKFKEIYQGFKITLVCDGVSLSGVSNTVYDLLKKTNSLEHITWDIFIMKTEQMHKDFLAAHEV